MRAKITITGAGGYIGRNLQQRVASVYRGVEVATLSRPDLCRLSSPSSAFGLYSHGLRSHVRGRPREPGKVPAGYIRMLEHELNVLEYHHIRDVIRTIRGSDALVHLAGSGRQSQNVPFSDSITRTVSIAVFLCKVARIPKIVYVSGLGASGDSPIAYMAAKYKAELTIRSSGLKYVILRPSYVVGRGDHLSSYVQQHAELCRGADTVPVPLDVYACRSPMQPIHIDDAADAIMWGALDTKSGSAKYDLVGPNSIQFYRYMTLLAKACGVKLNPITMEQAYLQALKNPEGAPFGVDDLGIIAGGYTSSHRRLAQKTGFEPRSVVGMLESGSLP